MTNKQAAQILREHKRLVRGADPFTRAIDTAIIALEQTEQTELERFKAALLVAFEWRRDNIKFMCVDADGEITQCSNKPRPKKDYWSFGADPYVEVVAHIRTLPNGINWRDCIIERA